MLYLLSLKKYPKKYFLFLKAVHYTSNMHFIFFMIYYRKFEAAINCLINMSECCELNYPGIYSVFSSVDSSTCPDISFNVPRRCPFYDQYVESGKLSPSVLVSTLNSGFGTMVSSYD